MADTFDAALDTEWQRAADELEWGAEVVTEWGVKYTDAQGSFVSLIGDNEQEARRWAARGDGAPGVARSVVARRVIYGGWQERL